MKYSGLFLFLSLILLYSCKKKDTIEKKYVYSYSDESILNPNKDDAAMTVTMHDNKPYLRKEFDFRFYIFKPDSIIQGLKYRSKFCEYNGSLSLISDPIPNVGNSVSDTVLKYFRKPEIQFSSKNLGIISFKDSDTILPSFAINNVIDTVFVRLNTTNTVTISNNAIGYDLSVSKFGDRFWDWENGWDNKHIDLGTSNIIYTPNDVGYISNLSKTFFLRLTFTKKNNILINNKLIRYSKIYEVSYFIALIP
jgi:hypothetical protein